MKGKTKSVVALLAVAALFGCAVTESPTANESEKWQPLFDGKTLKGWIQRGGEARYRVENGVIVGTTVPDTPNSFLCTKKHYANFILELDFKVDEGLNSGVQLRSTAYESETTIWLGTGKQKKKKVQPAGRVHGYQVEIDPSQAHYTKEPRNLLANGRVENGSKPRSWTGGIYDEARRGWLNDLTKNQPARKAFKQGKWNHFRIEAVGDSIKTWLNGVPAADLTDSMTPSGFIALQVHGSKSEKPLHVRWRNIRIQDLDRN